MKTKMFVLCDEYGRQYGGDDYSEVILFKKPYEWEDVKSACEEVKKKYEDTDADTSLYDAIWDMLEEKFEVEESISVNGTDYYIEW